MWRREQRYPHRSRKGHFETLHQYGEFVLPAHIWDLMALYACWIEPVTLNEWAGVMASYDNNQQFSKQTLFSALEWLDPERRTDEVRKRIEALKSHQEIRCVWSSSRLTQRYDVDHCLPFSRWPNNDLWNLLPATRTVNNQKKDKIPSHQQFMNAKPLILDWWKEAWMTDHASKERFFIESQFSLPGLNGATALDDVFEAVKLQSVRLVELQQLKVWQ